MARKSLLEQIDNVAKSAEIKGALIEIINVDIDKLLDYPENNEDITYTEDLEAFIESNGFADPLDITDFGMEPGYYMILCGHRRRAAARKMGYKTLPCIVRHFENKLKLKNFVMGGNVNRNPEREPLLYAKRYKEHEELLKEMDFPGNIRQEVARRLGMSVKQADRYKQLTKVILPVWDLISAEKVGMSSLLWMSKYSVEEQNEIFKIIEMHLDNGVELTRTKCEEIKLRYEAPQPLEGQMNISEIEGVMPMPVEVPEEKTAIEPKPATPVQAIEPTVKAEPVREPEPVIEPVQPVEPKADEEEPVKVEEPAPVVTEPEPQAQEQCKKLPFEQIMYYIDKVDDSLGSDYAMTDTVQVATMLKKMACLTIDMLYEMEKISKLHASEGNCIMLFKDVEKALQEVKSNI